MRSLRIAFFLSVLGVGIFLSSGLLNIVDRITEKTRKAWIGKELNESRLDNFYWLLDLFIMETEKMPTGYKQGRRE
ncbi:hypothetical protein LguiA_034910 [Lonicera macranthoides]